MNLYQNNQYLDDVQYVAGLKLPWEKLNNKTIMISGATGLVGSFLVDVLMEKNQSEDLGCTVYALGRNEQKAKKRFSKYTDDPRLVFIPYNVNQPFVRDDLGTIDYVLHLASNTHPMQYSTDPIGTITTNVIGLQNMLEFAVKITSSAFCFCKENCDSYHQYWIVYTVTDKFDNIISLDVAKKKSSDGDLFVKKDKMTAEVGDCTSRNQR